MVNASKCKCRRKKVKLLEGNIYVFLYKLEGRGLSKYELKFRCLRKKVDKFYYIQLNL